jgi:flagellar M-ring protein FliF
MDKIAQQITAFLKGLSPKQMLLLAGSILLVGGTIYGFVWLLGRGDYKTLYSGMAPADAQNLAQRLASQNILYQISTDGTAVLVPSDQLEKARLEVASQGPIASGRMGFELFDKPNWSGSDFSEKVNYQRALEAELERTIQTMSGVDSVRVHLVLPRESLFTDREHPAKAAVVLKLRGARLSEQVRGSVANLVSSAWDDLSPQNVTVVTTDGQVANQGHAHGAGITPGAADLETLLAERIVQTLTPVVGNDRVKSSVTIDYDPTSGESTQELYDPNATAVLSSQTSQETVGDLEPAGIPGTPSNTPAAQTKDNSGNATPAAQAAKVSNTSQGIHTESKTFAVSRTTHRLLEPAGRVKRVAAAILVDDAVDTKTEGAKSQEVRRKRTPDEMKQIEDLAKAAIGFDTKRGDLFSLQNITFTQAPVESPAPVGKVQRVLQFAERWTSLLRYVALALLFGVVYLLILRPVKNRVVAILQMPVPATLPVSAIAGGLGVGEATGGLSAGTPGSPGMDIGDAVALRKQLVGKVKEDPQAASRLIQNWMRKAEAPK